jgi:meso-butanediol dehydrogenase / (S,S)-butanediol dehydrogenase / diacetyl reductase
VTPAGGRLASQIVLVTGAASGIGRAVAVACAAEGAAVTGLDLDRPGLEDLRRELGDQPSAGFDLAVADVTSAAQVQDAASRLQSRRGQIDVLVNAAGISTMARVVDLSEDDWDRTLAVNTKGVFLMTRAVLPYMIDRGTGNVVNIASAAGKRGSRTLSHYCASKFAVIGFTQSVALEVAASGVRVNSVCPGLIATPMQEREVTWEATLRGTSEQAVRDRYLAAVPMGRIGTPQDVAATVVFLASEESAYITGEAIDVGGGYAIS